MESLERRVLRDVFKEGGGPIQMIESNYLLLIFSIFQKDKNYEGKKKEVKVRNNLLSQRFYEKGEPVRRKDSDEEIKLGEAKFVARAQLLESMHYSRGNQTGKKKLCYQIKQGKSFSSFFFKKNKFKDSDLILRTISVL